MSRGGGGYPRSHGIPTPSPPVLTPSGGKQNTYGWQAGGSHLTGMLLTYWQSFPILTLSFEEKKYSLHQYAVPPGKGHMQEIYKSG